MALDQVMKKSKGLSNLKQLINECYMILADEKPVWGKPPWQDLKCLIDLRNWLTHQKLIVVSRSPEAVDLTVKLEGHVDPELRRRLTKLRNCLKSRRGIQLLNDPSDSLHFMNVATSNMADWAFATTWHVCNSLTEVVVNNVPKDIDWTTLAKLITQPLDLQHVFYDPERRLATAIESLEQEFAKDGNYSQKLLDTWQVGVKDRKGNIFYYVLTDMEHLEKKERYRFTFDEPTENKTGLKILKSKSAVLDKLYEIFHSYNANSSD